MPFLSTFQIECDLKYEAIYDCFTPREEEILRTKFLLNELEQAVNKTEDSNTEFIDQCSTLKLFKFEYLFDNFGFTNCSLAQIFDAFRHKKACEENLEAKVKILMGFGAKNFFKYPENTFR